MGANMLDINVIKQSIPDSVSMQIQQLIAKRKLKPGDKLPSQRDLAEQLGIGRPAIREALKRLEAMGIVKVQHGKSSTIEKVDLGTIMGNVGSLLELAPIEVLQLLEAKEIIESQCTELAAQRATENDLAEMKGYLEEMEKNKKNPRVHAEADYLFHFTIVKAANNPFIIEITKVLGKMIEKAIEETAIEDDSVGREKAMRYHRSLYRAIRQKDGKKAADLLHKHSIESRGRYEMMHSNHHHGKRTGCRKK
jgi:GntR family transcriptional repressor for pyruvate dehydrogenase complex